MLRGGLRFKNGTDGKGPLHHDGDGTYKSPVCDHNYTPPKCSELFHAQSQTPNYPHGDGSCSQPCDCGRVPCGPYLFDHRQADTKVKGQTLREWFVAEMFQGPTGLGSPAVDGFYIGALPSTSRFPLLFRIQFCLPSLSREQMTGGPGLTTTTAGRHT